ncbi:hypothetical protein PG988_013350 [Apiospora saccharicola]
MVENDLNIKGIVNWELARRRPLQMALHLPDMVALDHNPERNEMLLGSVLQPSDQLPRNRACVTLYLSYLCSDDHTNTAATTVTSSSTPLDHAQMSKIMKILVSDPDADWNCVIIMACFSKGLHRWLAQRSWLVQETKRQIGFPSNKDIDMEVDEFLSAKANKGDGSVRNAVLKELNRRTT